MTPTAADMRELPELPTPGRVVEVRGSTWAVTDVVAQGLLRSPAKGNSATQRCFLHRDHFGQQCFGRDVLLMGPGHGAVEDAWRFS